jgi:TPR repeat protein
VSTLLERAYRLACGIGETSAPRAAVACLLSAADLDSAEAMYNLSLSYLYGFGVEPSLARSRFWASKCEALLAREAHGMASARLRSVTAGLLVASGEPIRAARVEPLSLMAKGQRCLR